MQDKILGAVSLGLSTACGAFIGHCDTAMFFSIVFFAVGAYEFGLGVISQRNQVSDNPEFVAARLDAKVRGKTWKDSSA